jgi:hypothetical protein
MPTQKDLIGDHPASPNEFNRWLDCDDIAPTTTKRHRSLTAKIVLDTQLIEWLGRKIFDHHHSDYRVKKLKENYKKLGFKKYASQHRQLPEADKVKKGNATEILLIEYVQGALQKDLIKAVKLKYNPNVDQAIKGDDTLMIDLVSVAGKDEIKIYLGEAKFRSSPSKQVVTDISKSLSKDKKPLSYSFLVNQLGNNADTEDLADRLDKFIIDEIKKDGKIIYTGFLLSDTKTSAVVETHLNSDNPLMVLISVGIDDPKELIKKAFEYAETLFANPGLI